MTVTDVGTGTGTGTRFTTSADGTPIAPTSGADRGPDDPEAEMTQPPQGTAYFPSIEKRYGKPISHWQQLLREHRAQHPDARHMQQVAWLKEEHGMGHGHANAVVAATPSG